MENNEIMINEEVMEEATDVVTTNSGKAIKIVAGIGLAALAGIVIYKVGKKVAAKIKATKEQSETIEAEYTELEDGEVNSNEAV